MEVFSPTPLRGSTPAEFPQQQQQQQQQFIRPLQSSRHTSHDPKYSRQPLTSDVVLPEHCIRICLSGNKSSADGDDPVQKFLQSSRDFQNELATEKSVMKYVKDILRDGENRVGCNPDEVSYRRIDISVIIGTPSAIEKCAPKQTGGSSVVRNHVNSGVSPEWFEYQSGNVQPAEHDGLDTQASKPEQYISHDPDVGTHGIGYHQLGADFTLAEAAHQPQQFLDPRFDPRLFATSNTVPSGESGHKFARPNSIQNPPPPYQYTGAISDQTYAFQREHSVQVDQIEPLQTDFSRASSIAPSSNASTFASMNAHSATLPAHMFSPSLASINRSTPRSRSQTPSTKIRKAPVRQRPRSNFPTKSVRISGSEVNGAETTPAVVHESSLGEGHTLATFDHEMDNNTKCANDKAFVKLENPEEYAVKELLAPATQEYGDLYLGGDEVGGNELDPYGL